MFGLVPFKMNNDFSNAEDEFNSLFGNFFGDEKDMKNSLKVDVKETKDSYVLEADFPGMKKEDINIEYNQNYLTISAKKNDEKEEKKENYIRKERSYGEVSRSFYVGNVDKEQIKAKFENGVLEVTLPKEQKAIDENSKIQIQ